MTSYVPRDTFDEVLEVAQCSRKPATQQEIMRKAEPGKARVVLIAAAVGAAILVLTVTAIAVAGARASPSALN